MSFQVIIALLPSNKSQSNTYTKFQALKDFKLKHVFHLWIVFLMSNRYFQKQNVSSSNDVIVNIVVFFYQHLEWCDIHFVNFNVLKDFSSIFLKSSIWSTSYPLVRQFDFQIESTNLIRITYCLMGMLWMFFKISQIFASQQNQHVSKTFLKISIMNFTFYQSFKITIFF